MVKKYANFVGREKELTLFRKLLKKPYSKVRILFALGSGGIGKTLLVKQMLGEAHQQGFLAAEEPIDLFSTDYRHIDGIQWKIKEIIENLQGLKGKSSPFADFVKGKTDTSEKFYECLKDFCSKNPLVLAFDTFENLDKVASDWLFSSDKGGLQVPGLICIVAGRYEKENLGSYRENTLVKEVVVSGFTIQEASKFYQKIADEFNEYAGEDLVKAAGMEPATSVQNAVEWIWKVTEGHPLRLEMAFHWLGTLLREDSLADLTPDKFDERLMQQVIELGERDLLDIGPLKVSKPVYDTLVCMAIVTRRFDEHFLRYLIGKGLIHLDEPDITEKDIIDNLEKYFFVKVRSVHDKEPVILQLHDEMARLVKQYVWPFHDFAGEKKLALLKAIEEYYDQLIAENPGERADILQVEKLYYTLQQDWKNAGKQQWFKQAEMADENINKLLPGEIKNYIQYYDPETQFEISRTIAEIERQAHHFNQSIGYWERVRKLGKAEKRFDWVVDALVGKFNASWQVDPEKALKTYLLPAKRLAEASVPEKIAQVYYEIGFAYRQMQDMKKAIKWYEKGIGEFRDRPQDDSLEATMRNDTGYIYLQLGLSGEAIRYLNAALEIRLPQYNLDKDRLEKASTKDQPALRSALSRSALFAGMSYNTLGEYHRYMGDLEEALKNYNEAYHLFSEAGNYYWQAKCLCARGETHRRLAWLANGTGNSGRDLQENIAQAQADMEESLYLCEKYQVDDERDTAYRRRGRLSHDLGIMTFEQNDRKLARKHLNEAYEFFMLGVDFAQRTKEPLEELENRTELAFLADDAIAIFGKEKVPSHYQGAVAELEKALKAHANDKPRIYQFPVFQALLQMEQAAIAFAAGDYPKALEGYIEAFKGLGTFPGYGHARYTQHFNYLTAQIEKLPKDEQVRWCKRFIAVWKETFIPDRKGKTLADGLDPDLVKWCNKLLNK